MVRLILLFRQQYLTRAAGIWCIPILAEASGTMFRIAARDARARVGKPARDIRPPMFPESVKG